MRGRDPRSTGFLFHSVSTCVSLALLSACGHPASLSSSSAHCQPLSLNGGPVQTYCFMLERNHAVFEGDIVLPLPKPVPAAAAAHRGSISFNDDLINANTWPNGVIPYTLAPDLPLPDRVQRAIHHYETFTNIQFVPRTDETDYVTFQGSPSACEATVGRAGGQQFVTLAARCSDPDVIHEIGHALGLWHEQSRSDRDRHVTIHWENMRPGAEIQFNQYLQYTQDRGRYDFHSIMHYGPYSYSANGQPTITRKDGTTDGLGPGTGLSQGDIDAIGYLYY